MNGTIKKGQLVSIGKEFIFFKASDTSSVQRVPRNDLLLIEDVRGVRYVIAKEENKTPKELKKINTEKVEKKNLLGIQLFNLLLGRATFAYERLIEKGTIGLVLPLSITFNPIGVIYRADTSFNEISKLKSIGIISGADVNFYLGLNENAKFFIGPRLRYGMDVFPGKVRGVTLQTQVGWRFSSPKHSLVQHLSVGFGFVRIISSALGSVRNPDQSYGWYSINYRFGVKW